MENVLALQLFESDSLEFCVSYHSFTARGCNFVEQAPPEE
jgi:hypothetical protein